ERAFRQGLELVSGHATIPTNGHETVPTSGHENSPPLAISKACSEAAAKECGCDQAAQSDCGKEQAKGGSGSRTHRGATTFASARTQRIGHQPPASPRPQDRAQVPAAAGSGGPARAAHLQTRSLSPLSRISPRPVAGAQRRTSLPRDPGAAGSG